MDVSYDVTGTLRASTAKSPPIVLVYDARGNGGAASLPPSPEITRTESQITQRF